MTRRGFGDVASYRDGSGAITVMLVGDWPDPNSGVSAGIVLAVDPPGAMLDSYREWDHRPGRVIPVNTTPLSLWRWKE